MFHLLCEEPGWKLPFNMMNLARGKYISQSDPWAKASPDFLSPQRTLLNSEIFQRHACTKKEFDGVLEPWLLWCLLRDIHALSDQLQHTSTHALVEQKGHDRAPCSWRGQCGDQVTDTILFVQQPAFNHPRLSSLHLSPVFLSPTLFSRCSWQWQRKDFWGYHSSSSPPLPSVSESLPLLLAHPAALFPWLPFPYLCFCLSLPQKNPSPLVSLIFALPFPPSMVRCRRATCLNHIWIIK